MTADGRDGALPEDVISAYVDGELTAAERVAFEQRLGVSPSWADILREVRETRAIVRALPVPEPPPGFLERLLDAAAVASVPATRTTRRALGPWRWAAGGAAAAAVAVAFLVPSPHRVTPSVPSQVDSHATRASLTQDPIMQLAPVAQPLRFGR
ncbi:MAG TPA: zf-HC2 domain-containing protein [Acidimicrobiia bacterium]|nr:zf-HC2 domain-containing protein [Acidimicrobiia bacterium]